LSNIWSPAAHTSFGTGSAITVSGCLNYLLSTTPVEFTIINNRYETETVELKVKDDNDASIFDHTTDVNPVSRGREGDSWQPELIIADTFYVNGEYQFSVEVIDSEFGIESNSKTVTADCTAEDTKVGGSWSVRLHSGGGVTVCDNNIC
jgi:hypothetical protein